MKSPIIFDGRNIFEVVKLQECEVVEYYPIGKPAPIVGDE